MSTTRTATEQVEVEYKVEAVREDGRVTGLEIRKWITTTELGSSGRRKRGTEGEFSFEHVATIDVRDVPELVRDLTGAIYGALADTERGLA